MKKILALLLALVMLFSVATLIAGCDDGNKKGSSSKNEESDDETTEPENDETTAPECDDPTDPEITDYKNVVDFYLSYNSAQLMAYDNGDGTVYVDMTADIIKRGNLDSSVWDDISQALATSGYDQLEEFYDGDGSNYIYISASFDDGSFFSTECYTEAPAELRAVIDAMVACFKNITTDLEDYVPVPMEMGEIADSDRAALNEILGNLELPSPADTFAISGFIKDEYFAGSLGLASDEGVSSGLKFAPQMMSVAYSLNIVTVEDAANANAVAADFEGNIDWLEWVCVQPASAYIAVKGNQVLRLLGSEDFYNATVAAIEAAGWTVYTTMDNPNV